MNPEKMMLNNDSVMNEQSAERPTEEKPQETILTPEQTAELYDNYLKKVGPRIMAHLIEANNVLTIKGERPQTEFFIEDPTPEDRQQLEKLNEGAERAGVYFSAFEEFQSPSDGKRTMMVGVFNASALERITQHPPIEGIPAYDARSGEKGVKDWAQKAKDAIKQAQANGKISDKYDANIILTGIVKGYPMTAIEDFQKWMLAGGDDGEMKLHSMGLPSVDLYGGARPEFDVAEKHKDMPEIKETAERWENALHDFYSTGWHKKIAHDKTFVAERAKTEKKE